MDLLNQWRTNAGLLTDWTLSHLVNRADAYGQYRAGRSFKVDGTLTRELLLRHYAGLETLGLYCYSTDGMGRWIVIDIDAHGEVDRGLTLKNVTAVDVICSRITKRGLSCIVEDSNGRGGFKIWIVFDQPIHFYSLRSLGLELVKDLLIEQPEVFPKSDHQTPYGGFVRLFGRHHKHKTFSKIIGSQDATQAILSSPINSSALVPIVTAPVRESKPFAGGVTGKGNSYFDMFAAANSWADILEAAGWEEFAAGRWTRPDKTTGISATTNDHVFYCFTDQAHPLEKDRGYNKCQLAKLLHFDNDDQRFYDYLERNYYNRVPSYQIEWCKKFINNGE